MEHSELLLYLAQILDRLSLRYIVTGSTASIVFGEARLTNDIDVVVDLPLSKVRRFCTSFPESEFYVSESAVREAIAHRRQFNIIHPMSGLKVDVIIPKETQFDETRLSRGIRLTFDADREITFASPEDVIIKKLDFYKQGESEKHLRDIGGVLKIRRGQLDFKYIEHWVHALDLTEIWQMVLQRANEPDTPAN